MLTSIRQVNEEFFRKFYGLKMHINGKESVVPCRYARKSSYDYVEEDAQSYPCIAIQDYTPTPKQEWYVDMHSYFGGKSLDGLTGYLYQRPIWMEFRYDVSIASKSYNDFLTMQDYFMENFVYGKRFVFNAQLEGEDLVGDIVPYSIRETDIPRTDGVYEMNYEFTLSVWLYPRKPEEIVLVQCIVIRCAPKGSELGKYAVTLDGKVVMTKDGVMIGVESEMLDLTFAELKEVVTNAVTSKDVDSIKVVPIEELDNIEKDPRTLYISEEK